ncbi:MAG: hypothetical protein Kow0068_20790 [Marinilabiliales bacterium]
MNLQKILKEVNQNNDNILIANVNDNVCIYNIDFESNKIEELKIENEYFTKNKKTLLYILNSIKEKYNFFTYILIEKNKICLYDIEKKEIVSKKYNLSVLGIMNFLNDNQLL